MKFFEVMVPVWVRETTPGSEDVRWHRDTSTPLRVTVHMGKGATHEDAVAELARRLEKLCNDDPPYEGG